MNLTSSSTEFNSGRSRVTELDYRHETWRKLLHLFALVMPIGYHLVPRWAAVMCTGIAFLVSLTVDIARFRNWSIRNRWSKFVDPIVRPRESHAFTGATHILLSGWLCPLLFDLPAAALAMSCIILGDTAAALVGRRWGTHHYNHTARSWEGSLAFLAASALGATLIPNLSLWIGLTGAIIATLVEAFSNAIDDNLSVPLIVGLYAHLALRLLS